MLMISTELALQGSLVHAVKAGTWRLARWVVLCHNTSTGRLLQGPPGAGTISTEQKLTNLDQSKEDPRDTHQHHCFVVCKVHLNLINPSLT